MFKDNPVLLQLKSQLSNGGEMPQAVKKNKKPAQAAQKAEAPKKPVVTPAQSPRPKVEAVPVTQGVTAYVHNHGPVIDEIYNESKRKIMDIAEHNWGKVGTDVEIQDILINVMTKMGVDAANRLIIETRLNKLGWKLQNTGNRQRKSVAA